MERFHPCRDDHAFALQFAHPYCPRISRDLFAVKLRESARGRIRLGELGEDRLLDHLLHRVSLGRAVAVGPSDDCAVVETQASRNFLVLKTDCVVEGVHFSPSANALDVGWKAMMRPLSDFAATSAVPQFALITLIAPEQTKVQWVKDLYRGLRQAAKRFEVSIVGGETSSTPGPISISASVVGFVERDRWVSRRDGKVGDDLFVTGQLGGALKQKHLRFIPRIVESRWLTKNFSIHAMMDLSDGLGADLPRLARASKVGFKIEMQNLPLTRGANIGNAISEGEDYELLFAISRRDGNRLEREWQKKFPKLPLTRIGSLSKPSTNNSQLLRGGYVHFQQPN
ncbi:MAG: thiamine-monophosphate kinase [Verrucomicrobia bacterium]|nr:MAG: thiamine-monophosphate kinase [Verrucomicrobiota bacterium]